jgi:hypothetical protein
MYLSRQVRIFKKIFGAGSEAAANTAKKAGPTEAERKVNKFIYDAQDLKDMMMGRTKEAGAAVPFMVRTVIIL